MDAQYLSRRRFLGIAIAGSTAAMLAACGALPSPASSAANGSVSPKPSGSQAASGAASPASAASASTQSVLKVVYVALAATQSPVWLATETGAFAKNNVRVDLQYIESALALKALVAKEVDVAIQSASAVIPANLNGGADLVYVASGSNHAQGEMVVASSIKSAADLKGKVLGNDRPGTTLDYYTQLELKLLGLQPADVTIRALGASEILLQALASGQIQAASMTPPQSLSAEAQGYPPLQNTYAVPYQGSGPIIVHSRLKDLTPALIPFLAAYRQGMQVFRDQPELAKSTIGKYAKIEDRVTLDRTYDFHVKSNPFQMDLKPTFEGIQAMLDFLSPTVPGAKSAKPEQFADLSLLAQLPAV